MFGMIAVYATMTHASAPDTLSGEVQQVVESPIKQEILVHNGYAIDSVIQNYANYAYTIGGMDFVKMIECENGRWDPKRVSKTHDHGLCQLNYRYNKRFINSADFADPYKQLDYCYEKYKLNPKLWYGPSRKIEGKKCSDYVSDRFDILVINKYDKIISDNSGNSENSENSDSSENIN